MLESKGPNSPFHELKFGNFHSDTNVSGFLPLDLNLDGFYDLMVAAWGVRTLRYFEKGWCKVALPCNNRGTCLASSGLCSCMLGYSGADCSLCSEGFFTRHSDKRSDYPGFACHAWPGRLRDNGTCSGRGLCFDDSFAKDEVQASDVLKMTSGSQLAFVSGNGTCICSPHFSGESCERGVCPAGLEYTREAVLAHCRPCKPGQHKPEADNHAQCRDCPVNHYAPEAGAAGCLACVGNIFIYSVNKEQTQCSMDVPTSLPILLCIACWSCIFYLVLLVFGLPVVVVDISKQADRIRIVSNGRHHLLMGRGATARFWGTGEPFLDTGQYDFKVTCLSNNELLLQQEDGAEVQNLQSSSGWLKLKPQQSFLSTGMFRIPYIAWCLLPGMVYAGLLHYQNVSDKGVMTSYTGLHVAIGCFMGLLAHRIRHHQLARTCLRKDIKSFRRELLHKNPQPVRCPRGPSRALQAGQLCQFLDYFAGYIGPSRTMYYICHNIILPITRRYKLSYAELAGPTETAWFVSHYWGTSFSHFASTICKHAQEALMSQTGCESVSKWQYLSYWICSFSNNQWDVEEEVGQSWEESSFYLAMRSVGTKGTVMVFDELALPLTRSWCLFELLQTQQLSHERPGNFVGLMLCSPLGVMNHGNGSLDLAMNVSHKLANLRLQDASASKSADKEMINNLVVTCHGGFSKINAFLIRSVREVLQATQLRFKEDLRSLQLTLDAAEKREAMGVDLAPVDFADHVAPCVERLQPSPMTSLRFGSQCASVREDSKPVLDVEAARCDDDVNHPSGDTIHSDIFPCEPPQVPRSSQMHLFM